MCRAHHRLFTSPSCPGSPFDGLVEILGRKEIVAPFLDNRLAVSSPAEALVDVVDIAEGARMAAPNREVQAPAVRELLSDTAVTPRGKSRLPYQWRRHSVRAARDACRESDLHGLWRY